MQQEGLWFIRHKPKKDELLSSWIVRLAHAQGMKLESFCYRSWGRGAQVMSSDVDLDPVSAIKNVLMLRTGAESAQVEETTLAKFSGTLFKDISKNGLTQWVTHLGNRKRKLPTRGLSFCPLCLKSDQSPYCRRIWRTAFATMCVTHKIQLQENCPHCGTPFSIHRWDKGQHPTYQGNPITHCSQCRLDRTTVDQINIMKDVHFIEFQWTLERAMRRGWINVAGRTVDALQFFSGLSILAQILLDRRRSDRLKNVLKQRGFVEMLTLKNTRNMRFECLDIELRHEIMQVLALFFQDWPTSFIDVCRSAKFSSSYIFDNARDSVASIPFWLWEPVHLMLDGTWYAPSDSEIDAVVSYLRRTKKEFKKIDVVRLLGVSWLNKATLRRLSNEFDSTKRPN